MASRMRFQAASLSLVMMTISIAPALAQEAAPAEQAAPVGPVRTTQTRSEAKPVTRMASPGMLAGGVALTAGGLLSAVAGLALSAGQVWSMGYGARSSSKASGAALPLMAGGAISGAIGIPLIVFGALEVPSGSVSGAPAAQLRVGAGSAEFSMSF
jgi:hypothetical protein